MKPPRSWQMFWRAMDKVVLITGGSSGIGLATAQALAERGCIVYEMSRHGSSQPGIRHLTGDVTVPEQIAAAVKTVLEQHGRIDILINNAGFGISGAGEFISQEAANKQLQVNFLGCDAMCRRVIPVMRKAGKGRIVNLSSVAAVIPIPFQAHYSASKAAINAYSMALDNEVRPFGIRVCAVMPGDIRTGFTGARQKTCAGDEIYQGRIRRSVSKMEQDEENGMDPAVAGRRIAHIALRAGCKPLSAIRLDYQLFCVLAKVLPCRLLNWLIGLLYAK